MTSKPKEISVIKTYALDKPAEMVTMATVLKAHIVKNELYTNIKGRNYAHVDGWQFAGFLTNLTAIVESVKDLSTDKEIKWQAEVKVYAGDKHISSGFAVCSNKEAIKKGFDEYAILSMAQTRAIGKAYRNKLGWVMKLAGYESTPVEEMKKVDGKNIDLPAEKTTAEAKKEEDDMKNWPECQNGCGAVVSPQVEAYSKKMFKGKIYCRDCQKEKGGKR